MHRNTRLGSLTIIKLYNGKLKKKTVYIFLFNRYEVTALTIGKLVKFLIQWCISSLYTNYFKVDQNYTIQACDGKMPCAQMKFVVRSISTDVFNTLLQ